MEKPDPLRSTREGTDTLSEPEWRRSAVGLPEETLRTGQCSSRCAFFKCAKNVLVFRNEKLWCNWIEDACTGSSCPYAVCIRGKFLPQNKCGMMVRRITTERFRPDDFKVGIKMKGKLASKLGKDYDIV